jgi:hypothetical protein
MDQVNSVPEQKPGASTEKPSPSTSRLNLLVALGQGLATCLPLLYLAGFVVVTAHLGRFGIREYDAFKWQYLVAGCIFAVFALGFAFFCARHLIALDEDAEKMRQVLEEHGARGARWALFAGVFSFIEAIYLSVVGIYLVSLLLIPGWSSASLMLLVFMAYGQFLIDSSLQGPKTRLTPRAFILLAVFQLLVIATALYRLPAQASSIGVLFFGLAMSVFLFGTHWPRLKKSPLAIGWAVVALTIASAGGFGASAYEQVRQSIGGGAPTPVRLVLAKDSLPANVLTTLAAKDDISNYVDLLAETSDELVVGISKREQRYEHVLRVKRGAITGLIYEDPRKALDAARNSQ